MRVISSDFSNGGSMHKELTCDGNDKSPNLRWDSAPEGTKSFALSCIDPDAPLGDFMHWLVCDIPLDVNEAKKGQEPAGTPVRNDFGRPGYGGPCPPSGKHRYVFTVYALDVSRLEGVDRDNFVDLANQHAIEKSEIMGTYRRR